MRDQIQNPNFPMDGKGRTYHVGAMEGQVANRILTVGDPRRAERISKLLDQESMIKIESDRGFVTYTGVYGKEKVSIIAIGMGFPVADMMIREVRHITKGTLLIIRLGSCGGIGKTAKTGLVSVAKEGSLIITKNYDFWKHQYRKDEKNEVSNVLDTGFGVVTEMFHQTFKALPYHISGLIPSDPHLSLRLQEQLQAVLGSENVMTGINASCDSFYSSQGRIDPSFGDFNEKMIEAIVKKYPNAETMEMETGLIYHLAQACTYACKNDPNHVGAIRASACAMVYLGRNSTEVIDAAYVPVLEEKAGKAVLEALIATPLDEEEGWVDE